MDTAIAAVRGFNRFYTGLIGALDARFLDSDVGLPEARLLYEIVRAERPLVAAELQAASGLDAGFASRLLRRLEERGWIARGRVAGDARRRPIAPTEAGHAAFAEMDARQRERVAAMLAPLDEDRRRALVDALGAVRALLDPAPPRTVSLRTFRTGDMGLIAARQSILYDRSHGWGRGLETIEAEVTAAFLRNFKPGREQCWVAELDGAMAGSVFLTDEGEGLARLRLLYVEPHARGLGIGDRLVRTCVDFAREAGYGAITLWTHSVLESARRIYAAHGFEIVERHVHEVFGRPEPGETWRLELRPAP